VKVSLRLPQVAGVVDKIRRDEREAEQKRARR
jgi:hypothetical protein